MRSQSDWLKHVELQVHCRNYCKRLGKNIINIVPPPAAWWTLGQMVRELRRHHINFLQKYPCFMMTQKLQKQLPNVVVLHFRMVHTCEQCFRTAPQIVGGAQGNIFFVLGGNGGSTLPSSDRASYVPSLEMVTPGPEWLPIGLYFRVFSGPRV